MQMDIYVKINRNCVWKDDGGSIYCSVFYGGEDFPQMKINIYTLIFFLAIGSALVISNVLHQGILGTAIIFLIAAGIKKSNRELFNSKDQRFFLF